jgi:hypothetical protein
VRYDAVNVMLLNEFLKEHKRVQDEGRELAGAEATIAGQEKLIEAMASRLNALDGKVRQIDAQIDEAKPQVVRTAVEQ